MTDAPTIPAGRERLRKMSGWTAVSTAVLLAVGWFADWYYIVMLLLWFLAWLALGHWYFCRSLWVRQRHVRLIDYLYLSAGAVSILLAASQYQEARSQYARMLDEVFIPSDRADLKAYVDREQKDYCSGAFKEFVPAKYCDWLATLQPFLDSHYTAADLEPRIKEGRDLIDTEQWDSWWVTLRIFMTYGEGDTGRRNFVNPNNYQDRMRLVLGTQQSVGRATRIIVRAMEKVARDETTSPGIVTRHAPAPEGFIPAVRGLGFTVIWPLLLTFALAVRFIKVTAEVSGWVT